MDSSNKIKYLSKIFSKRFPFIKKIEIEDNAYISVLFLKAKIDVLEMCDFYGFTPKDHYKNINASESNTFMSFVIENQRDRAYEINKQLNDELDEINKLLPEEFRLKKSPNIFRFFGVDNPIF